MQNNQREMQRLTTGLPTKSAKIRKLGGAGYSRQQIADFLGIRYQHVRNVLVDEERKATAPGGLNQQGFAEEGSPVSPERNRVIHLEVRTDGSILVPADAAAEGGLLPGGAVVIWVQGAGDISLLSPVAAAKRVQDMVRRFVPESVSLVDELIEERRREFALEEAEFARLYGKLPRKADE